MDGMTFSKLIFYVSGVSFYEWDSHDEPRHFDCHWSYVQPQKMQTRSSALSVMHVHSGKPWMRLAMRSDGLFYSDQFRSLKKLVHTSPRGTGVILCLLHTDAGILNKRWVLFCFQFVLVSSLWQNLRRFALARIWDLWKRPLLERSAAPTHTQRLCSRDVQCKRSHEKKINHEQTTPDWWKVNIFAWNKHL